MSFESDSKLFINIKRLAMEELHDLQTAPNY